MAKKIKAWEGVFLFAKTIQLFGIVMCFSLSAPFGSDLPSPEAYQNKQLQNTTFESKHQITID